MEVSQEGKMKDQINIQSPKSIIVTNWEQPRRHYKTSNPSIPSPVWPHGKSWPVCADPCILVLIIMRALEKINLLPYMVLSWALLLFVHNSLKKQVIHPHCYQRQHFYSDSFQTQQSKLQTNYKQNNNLCAEISGVIRSNKKKKLAKTCFYYKGIKIQRTSKAEISHQPEKRMLIFSMCTSALIRAVKQTHFFIRFPKKHSQKPHRTNLSPHMVVNNLQSKTESKTLCMLLPAVWRLKPDTGLDENATTNINQLPLMTIHF